MAGVFLSYRRVDTQDVAGRLFDRLVEHFSREQVFKDVDSLPAGVPFPEFLEQTLRAADAVLVLIGPHWMTCRGADGKRRLEDPLDFVRVEVELSLQLGLPTIPVFVGQVAVPTASDLPESLRPLFERQGLLVRPDPDFHNDAARLIRRLTVHVEPQSPPGLRFVTNGLDNDEFIFAASPWPFPIDPRGEDISSKHAPRSERRGLVAHRPFTSDQPTIAVKELIVDFHIHNPTGQPRYLEAIYLEVERVFPVTSGMFWNTWLPILDPHQFEVSLDPAQDFYELDLKGRLVEVLPNRAEHFRIEVCGGPSCAQRIFRFRLGVTSHDLEGVKEETVSDRSYHLAFSSETFTTPK